MNDASAAMMQLRPVIFNYKTDPRKTKQFGLIAEEVAQVIPELVVFDKESQPYTVRYHDLPVLLLNELQKLYAKVQSQDKIINELIACIEILKKENKE